MISGLTLTNSLLLLVAICAGATAEEYESFEFVRVYKVELKDPDQIKMFKQLEVPVNVINDIGTNGGSLDVVVAPKDRINFEQSLERIGASFKVIMENFEEMPEERIEAPSGRSKFAVPAMEWTEYHSLQDINDFVDYLAARYPELVETRIIGYSYEGRPIKAIIISYKPGNKAIFMESHIHAAEWISSAASTCFIHQLLTSEDLEVQRLLQSYDWILVPVLNPDGLVYSKKLLQRFWRKNRKPTGFSNILGDCIGTDLNRNFDDGHFKEAGANINDSCTSSYGGNQSNSEPEVIALQNFFHSFPKFYICIYVAWHSYGNKILLPYGYTNEVLPPNFNDMMDVAQAFSISAATRYGTSFEYGSSGVKNYRVAGTGKDWAYIKTSVCFAATLELRPETYSLYSFSLPPAQIIPVCLEVTDGWIGMMKKVDAMNFCDGCPEKNKELNVTL